MATENKVIAFCKGFKYQGVLVEETDTTYKINDYKEGIVKLPKSSTIIKELK